MHSHNPGVLVNSEAHYGRLLAPYLEDPAHVFIVSSDFCHWGTRFNYVFYDRSRARPSLTPPQTWQDYCWTYLAPLNVHAGSNTPVH